MDILISLVLSADDIVIVKLIDVLDWKSQMVKLLDELIYPPLEDHIGWRLWQLSELWKQRFDLEMSALGHPYFAEARGNVIRHIAPAGTAQAIIVQQMGISKQAVQQLIDDLETDGVVTRQSDQKDKRSRIVVLTQKGLKALHDAKRIKKKIETDFGKLIGVDRMARLSQDLDALAKLIERPT
jgi:DNA-binding MarR family transcriptional regulator